MQQRRVPATKFPVEAFGVVERKRERERERERKSNVNIELT